jgi:hypothetical protein
VSTADTQRAIAADEAAERGGVTPAQVLKEKGLLPFVVVRTYGAGVHLGLLSFQKDQTVELLDARRLWRWATEGGANTLNEVALHGVDRTQTTRISETVRSIQLLTAIEIIPAEEAAVKTFDPIWLG